MNFNNKVAQLTDLQREIILKKAEGKTLTEIGSELNYSQPAVTYQLKLAKYTVLFDIFRSMRGSVLSENGVKLVKAIKTFRKNQLAEIHLSNLDKTMNVILEQIHNGNSQLNKLGSVTVFNPSFLSITFKLNVIGSIRVLELSQGDLRKEASFPINSTVEYNRQKLKTFLKEFIKQLDLNEDK